ncbi:hypothetical protein [Streptomyces sp. NPDC055094]
MTGPTTTTPEGTAPPVFAPVMTSALVAEVTLGRKQSMIKDADFFWEEY